MTKVEQVKISKQINKGFAGSWLCILTLLFSCCIFSGCVSTPLSPEPELYTLIPEKLMDKSVEINATVSEPVSNIRYLRDKELIGIKEVYIPDYIDKKRIVIRSSDKVNLDLLELHRWAEPLALNIQRILAQDIADYLPTFFVKPIVRGGDDYRYIVKVEIISLDIYAKGKIDIEAWWTIMDSAGNVVTAQKFEDDAIYTVGDYQNMAKIVSKILSLLSYEVAERLADLG